jgi:hypothetical protein
MRKEPFLAVPDSIRNARRIIDGRERQLSSKAATVWAALESFIRDQLQCAVGLDILAARASIPRRTVQRCLKELVEFKMLKITRRRRGFPNIYELIEDYVRQSGARGEDYVRQSGARGEDYVRQSGARHVRQSGALNTNQYKYNPIKEEEECKPPSPDLWNSKIQSPEPPTLAQEARSQPLSASETPTAENPRHGPSAQIGPPVQTDAFEQMGWTGAETGLRQLLAEKSEDVRRDIPALICRYFRKTWNRPKPGDDQNYLDWAEEFNRKGFTAEEVGQAMDYCFDHPVEKKPGRPDHLRAIIRRVHVIRNEFRQKREAEIRNAPAPKQETPVPPNPVRMPMALTAGIFSPVNEPETPPARVKPKPALKPPLIVSDEVRRAVIDAQLSRNPALLAQGESEWSKYGEEFCGEMRRRLQKEFSDDRK